ncbi:MAG: EpsG family protein [Flavobacterium sp.]|jgi:hypothetical protein
MRDFYFFDPNYYTKIYFFILIIIVLFTSLYFLKNNWIDKIRYSFSNSVGYIFLFIYIFYLSFRPIYINSGDMPSYMRFFNTAKNTAHFDWNQSEKIFYGFMHICSKIMIPEFYFAIIAAIYVLCAYLACKNWFKNDWFLVFLFYIISFQFLNYGINGIRNGLATSVFLLAISRKNIFYQILFFYIAFGIHKSLFLPIFAYSFTYFFNYPKYYIFYWLLCIPLSITNGVFFEDQLKIYYDDDKLDEYFEKGWYEDQFSQVGFRWDFIIYSFMAIGVGYFYIYIKKFNDTMYKRIYNSYIICNGFWILIIGMSYSNRIAYLSWFLIAIIITYPLMKEKLFEKQNHFFVGLLSIYFILTLFLNRLYL